MNSDIASTVAGGGLGLHLLSQIRWELIPAGECVRLAVSLALIAGGYAMYRSDRRPPAV